MWFLRPKNKSDEADQAIKEAQAAKRVVEKRGPKVTELVQDMRELRQRNHFVEQLAEIIVKHGGTFNDT